MITRWFPAAALALLLVGSSLAVAESGKKPSKKDDSSFGSLRSADAAEARNDAKAWLESVKKADNATLKKFDEIWDGDRPVLDKVAATLALGDADAARLLGEARESDSLPPTEVPAALRDKSKPAFYRNNLALAYARALTLRKVYEEALETFALVKAEDTVDPAAHLFHKGVCEYELMLKDQADDTLARLRDVSDAPQRYLQVASLMSFDMETWGEKDLGWIARKMDNIQRRLALKRGGKQTQRMQKEVLVRLDEMIKELENQQKKGGG